ncbi:MAG: bifunctional metallophosphatase/5'-nucleotidase [Syntrophomonadaceae bacterium]
MRRLRIALGVFLWAARLSAVTLTILHTSDLHGRVHPHDALADADLGEGLARVATAVKAVRAEGGAVLLLDSGDTIQGAPEQALVFSGRVGAGSDPTVRAMNLVGYDAMAVGNHDFDFGLARLEASRKEARFPWLSANTLGADGQPALPPYVVRTIAGVRVGILGLVTPHVGNWESPALLAGLRFGDSVEAARRWVPVLRGRERCDLVIVLAHESFEKDPRGEGTPRRGTGRDRLDAGENQAWAVATQVEGIDLLLSGHAHAVIAPTRLGNVWVSQPGRWGNTLTRFDVTLERAGEGFRVSGISGRNLPMRRIAPDAEVVAAVAPEHDAAMAALADSVAVLDAPVSAEGARRRDSALLDWLLAVERREGGADLAFASLLPAAMDDWPAGPLTLRQIWSFYPYENGLVTVSATGRQVRAALERAAACAGRPEEPARNCDALSGADYVLDLSLPAGHRVVSLTRGGAEIADGDVLTVALNSYRASGGGGYPMWKSARRMAETGNLRDLLAADARTKKRLLLTADGNWKTVGVP